MKYKIIGCVLFFAFGVINAHDNNHGKISTKLSELIRTCAPLVDPVTIRAIISVE